MFYKHYLVTIISRLPNQGKGETNKIKNCIELIIATLTIFIIIDAL